MEQETPINPDWITTAEAAKLLDLTTRRIRQLVAEGELVGQLAGPRFLLISKESVEEFDRSRT